MIKIVLDNSEKSSAGDSIRRFCVFDGERRCGSCEFELCPPQVRLISAVCEESALLDGLLRQTLSYSLDCGCPTAVFDKTIAEALYSLRILKDPDALEFDILDFFAKLNGCEKF